MSVTDYFMKQSQSICICKTALRFPDERLAWNGKLLMIINSRSRSLYRIPNYFLRGEKVWIEALQTEITNKAQDSYTSLPALPPSPAVTGGTDTSPEQRRWKVVNAHGAPVFTTRSSSGMQRSWGRVGRGSEAAGVDEQGCYISLSNGRTGSPN